MTNAEFEQILRQKGYEFKHTKGCISVTQNGSVDLPRLTALPEGVKFENHGYVDLPRLTTLPEGVKFENHGYVYLPSLTALPEGVKFENHGYVDLDSLTTLPEGVKFENHGSVYLDSLTTLPEGVKFENHGYVDLRSLTTLLEGVKFENHGYVYLRSLTTLLEGVKFENHGSVYLDSLTTLPEGVKFENHGYVDLPRLTTLPEGVKFENHGSVYLPRLTGKHMYLGKEREFRTIDDTTMILTGSKSYGGHAVHSARYFAGGEVAKMKRCYIAEGDSLFAHGDTMKSAVDDLQYKMADSADKSAVAKKIVDAGKVTLPQFRALTGACREGIRQHLSGVGIILDEIEDMPLSDALKAMAGTSYGTAFKQHVDAATPTP